MTPKQLVDKWIAELKQAGYSYEEMKAVFVLANIQLDEMEGNKDLDVYYVCETCEFTSNLYANFQTDLDAGQSLNELTCEDCYDEMNE
jgi:hypothetical protein